MQITSLTAPADTDIFLYPIPTQSFTELKSTPQVVVSVSGMKAQCRSEASCDYKAAQDQTPLVSSVDKGTAGSGMPQYTITGTNLDSGVPSEAGISAVTVAAEVCSVVSRSSSTIVCDLAVPQPAGFAAVLVYVPGKVRVNTLALSRTVLYCSCAMLHSSSAMVCDLAIEQPAGFAAVLVHVPG